MLLVVSIALISVLSTFAGVQILIFFTVLRSFRDQVS